MYHPKYSYGLTDTDNIMMLSTLLIELRNIMGMIREFNTLITMLFILRRFLDKTYIEKGIAYVPHDVALSFILILVRDFDFKITKCSYSTIDSIEKINSKIKKSNSIDISKILLPIYCKQCANISMFENLFSK